MLENYPYTRPSLAYIYHHIDLPYLPVVIEMEQSGILVDVGRLQSLVAPTTTRLNEIQELLFLFNDGPWNLNSPAQASAFLYEKLGLRPYTYATDDHGRTRPYGPWKVSGQNTTGAEALDILSQYHVAANLLREYRRLTKLKGTYIDVLIEEASKRPDHRVFPHYNQTTTITGRLSSSDPLNAQNIPKRVAPGTPPFIEDLIKQIRMAIVARPGWRIVKFDQSQVEYRILVCLARDDISIGLIWGGRDIHLQALADSGFLPSETYESLAEKRRAGDPEINKLRDVFKNIVYGVVYDQGVDMTIHHLAAAGVQASHDQSRSIHLSVLRSRPAILRWKAENRRLVLERGYAETYHGRRAYYPDVHHSWEVKREEALRSAGNMPIQGTSADAMKMVQTKIREIRKGARMKSVQTIAVHDEAVYESPEGEVEVLRSIIKEVGSGIIPEFPIPLDVEVESGLSWGKTK